MKIKTPTGAHPADVANFMQATGIGGKLEQLRQKHNGALIVTFYSEDEPIFIEVGGGIYLIDTPNMQLPCLLEISYTSAKFRIETAEDLFAIINSHLNRFTK